MTNDSNSVISQLQVKLWTCYDAATAIILAWPCPTVVQWAVLRASVDDIPSEQRFLPSDPPQVTPKYPPNAEPNDNPAFGTW